MTQRCAVVLPRFEKASFEGGKEPSPMTWGCVLPRIHRHSKEQSACAPPPRLMSYDCDSRKWLKPKVTLPPLRRANMSDAANVIHTLPLLFFFILLFSLIPCSLFFSSLIALSFTQDSVPCTLLSLFFY